MDNFVNNENYLQFHSSRHQLDGLSNGEMNEWISIESLFRGFKIQNFIYLCADLIKNFNTNVKKRYKMMKRIAFIFKHFSEHIRSKIVYDDFEFIAGLFVIAENRDEILTDNDLIKRLKERTEKVTFLKFGEFQPDAPKEAIKGILTKEICSYPNIYKITSKYVEDVAKDVEIDFISRKINIEFVIVFKGSNVMRSHLINFSKDIDTSDLYPISDNDVKVDFEYNSDDFTYEEAFTEIMNAFYTAMKRRHQQLFNSIKNFIKPVSIGGEILTYCEGLDFLPEICKDGVLLHFSETESCINTQSNFIKAADGSNFGLIRHKLFFKSRFGTIFNGEIIDVGFNHASSSSYYKLSEKGNLLDVSIDQINGTNFEF